MRLRILVIEPSEPIRDSLAMFVESHEHEVIAVPRADICHNFHEDFQGCPLDSACCDATIIGQDLPLLTGIDFIERKLKGGCKGIARHKAIICRPWSDTEKSRAARLGCRFFETPLKLSEIEAWLKDVEKDIPKDRRLADIPSQYTQR